MLNEESKLEYNLVKGTNVVLIKQNLLGGVFQKDEEVPPQKGIVAADVKIGISLRFNKNDGSLQNATGPVIAITKKDENIFIEAKGSGVSQSDFYLCMLDI